MINLKINSLDAKKLLTNPSMVTLDTMNKLMLSNISINLDPTNIDILQSALNSSTTILGIKGKQPAGAVTTVNIAGHELTTTSSNPVLTFDGSIGSFSLTGCESNYVVNDWAGDTTAIPLLGAPDLSSTDGLGASATLTPGETYYYTYYYDDGSETFAVMIIHNGNVSWAHSIAGDFSIEWTSGSSVKIGGYVDGDGNYFCNTSFIGLSTVDDNNVTGTNDIPYGKDVHIGMWPEGGVERSYIYYLYDNDEGELATTATFYSLPSGGTTYELLGTFKSTSSNPYVRIYDGGDGAASTVDYCGNDINSGTGLDGYNMYNADGEVIINSDHSVGGTIDLVAGSTYTFYLVFCQDEFINPNTITTINIAGHELTTTSSNPKLYFDSGSCYFELYDGDISAGNGYTPTDTYTGYAIPLFGAPELGNYESWTELTPGETYYYTYYYDDGSPTFAVMINHNGKVTWERAIAGEFWITWMDDHNVDIGGSYTRYTSNSSYIGLSAENDGNVTNENDIPWGTDVEIAHNSQWESKRSYVYYLYDQDSDLSGSGSSDSTLTSVTILNPDGTSRGTLTTTEPNPTLTMSTDDSGILYLSNASGGDYTSSGLIVCVNGWYPAGFSCDNDNNLGSPGDITWADNSTVSLEAYREYTYYVYGPDDLEHVHSYGNWVYEILPTCTTSGTVGYYKCSGCNKYFDEDYHEISDITVAAYGHKEGTAVEENRIEPTCEKTGSYDSVVYCTRSGCGKEISRKTIDIPATGHNSEETWSIETTTYPTCTDQGTDTHTRKCITCKTVLETKTTAISALGHEFTVLESDEVAPTCTTDGKTAIYSCTRCGDLTGGETIDKLGHSPYDTPEIENEVAATCTTGRSYDLVYYCSRCGVELERTSVVEDELREHNYKTSRIDSTCTTQGYDLHTCLDCGDTYKDNYTDMVPHTYGDWTATEQQHRATCNVCGDNMGEDHTAYLTWESNDSQHRQYCTKCDWETVDWSEHNWSAWETDETGSRQRRYCIDCNYVQICDHEEAWSEWEKNTGTHCKRTCGICGAVETQEHIWPESDWDIDDETHSRTCKDCGFTDSAYHTSENGWTYNDAGSHKLVCDVCGHTYDHEAHDIILTESVDDTYHRHYCSICGNWDEEHVNTTGWVYNFTNNAASCIKYCDACGHLMEEKEHDFGETHDGWTYDALEGTRTCKDCGYTQTCDHTIRPEDAEIHSCKCGYIYGPHEFHAEYVSNEDGWTHTAFCECGAETQEQCIPIPWESDSKCELCDQLLD